MTWLLVVLLPLLAWAQGAAPLVELTMGGTVHDVPVTAEAVIYRDQTWRMDTRSLPGALPALAFTITGHVEFWPGEPSTLHFTTDYARTRGGPTVVDVVIDCGPRGRGLYAARETAGTKLDDLQVRPEFPAQWRARAARGEALGAIEKELLRCVPLPA